MAIRVLHIIGHLRLGGAQVVVKQLVEHNNDPTIQHFVYPLRCRPVEMPIEGSIIQLPYPNYDPRKFFAIFSLCKQYKIDIIHAHLHKPVIGALLTRYFIPVPVIVHEHGSIAIEGFQYFLYCLALRLLKNKAQRYVAVSNSIAKDLALYSKIPSSSIKVVYNAVDLKKFSPNSECRRASRNELHIMANDIAIGYVGRLSCEKGPDILLDAFENLTKINSRFLLIFVGDGTMKQSLMEKAQLYGLSERVRFLGFRGNVAEIMNVFDIGCLPSRRDAFGLTAIEFMSMKIPLIASSAGGLGEILTDGQNALIPQKNTPADICRSVLRMIGEPGLKERLIDNAYRYVQTFDIPSFVRQVNDIYREIAEKS